MATQSLQLADGRAILSDTVTDRVFGPIFETVEAADDFVSFCRHKMATSPRRLDAAQLDRALTAWRLDVESYPRPNDFNDDEETTESMRRSSGHLAVAQEICGRLTGRR